GDPPCAPHLRLGHGGELAPGRVADQHQHAPDHLGRGSLITSIIILDRGGTGLGGGRLVAVPAPWARAGRTAVARGGGARVGGLASTRADRTSGRLVVLTGRGPPSAYVAPGSPIGPGRLPCRPGADRSLLGPPGAFPATGDPSPLGLLAGVPGRPR